MVVISDYPTRPIMFVEIKFEREGEMAGKRRKRRTGRPRASENKGERQGKVQGEQSPCTVSDVVQGLEVFIRDAFETAGIGD